MSTRLDRLLVLLDKGTTTSARKAAARQIGEILKYHPQDLPNLLNRVHIYLKSESWETRAAASEAIRCIANNVPEWAPEEVDPEHQQTPDLEFQLAFDSFDILRIIEHGTALFGSAGTEYDEEENSGLTAAQRLALHKKNLAEQLEITAGGAYGDLDIEIKMEDLDAEKEMAQKRKAEEATNRDSKKIKLNEEVSEELQGMSIRERNRMKRLQRSKNTTQKQMLKEEKNNKASADSPQGKVGGNVGGNVGDSVTSSLKKKGRTVITEQTDDNKIMMESFIEQKAGMDSFEWPFESFCEELCCDLFASTWEVRHGAGQALREIILAHGSGAGKSSLYAADQQEKFHLKWLEDISLRLLCVFALDKVGDFAFDQVVAPVRETCAQALGALLKFMSPVLVEYVLKVLLQLQTRKLWEVRYGGLLGLKYIVAVRKDMADSLLPQVLPAVLQGLYDKEDDVRAVAAEVLLPIVPQIVAHSEDSILALLKIIWKLLLDLDEVTASTVHVMAVLGKLLSFSTVTALNEKSTGLTLTELVPRLCSFFLHSNKNVRLAALRALNTIIESDIERAEWMIPIAKNLFRNVFQVFLVDKEDEVFAAAKKVWICMLNTLKKKQFSIYNCVGDLLIVWFRLVSTPRGAQFNLKDILINDITLSKKQNLDLKLEEKQIVKTEEGSTSNMEVDLDDLDDDSDLDVDGNEDKKKVDNKPTNSNKKKSQTHRRPAIPLERDLSIRIRLAASNALAILCLYFDENQQQEQFERVYSILKDYFKSLSCCKRLVAACFLNDLALLSNQGESIHPIKTIPLPEELVNTVHGIITEQYEILYSEMEPHRRQMRADIYDIIQSFHKKGLPETAYAEVGDFRTYNEDMARTFVETIFPKWWTQMGASIMSEHSRWLVIENQRLRLESTIKQLSQDQTTENISILAACAYFCIITGKMTAKLNPIIQPLMKSLRCESDIGIQQRSGKAIAGLLKICVPRAVCPNSKIVKNICTFTCADSTIFPPLEDGNPEGDDEEVAKKNRSIKSSNIWSLQKELLKARIARRTVPKKEEEETQEVLNKRIQSRGGNFACQGICEIFQNDLETQLPQLWKNIGDPLEQHLSNPNEFGLGKDKVQPIINALQNFIVVVPMLPPSLHHLISSCSELLLSALSHPHRSVRFMTAKAFAVMSEADPIKTFPFIIRKLLPKCKLPNHILRQGCVESLHVIVQSLDFKVVPYLAFLVLPVLGRMSDQDYDTKCLAAYIFAALVKLMALEAGSQPPEGLDEELLAIREEERKFVTQLLDSKSMDDVKIPAFVNADLRSYQQEGINWMSFLKRYNLHGILGDDMGLGKTLQAICIMSLTMDETDQEGNKLPHLVICPATLCGHWYYEIKKFSSKLKAVQYVGYPEKRASIIPMIRNYDIIITSYELARKDGEILAKIPFSFCILDEGHIIKNPKNKLTHAVKSLNSQHRIILSGTPIQNNVVELWSLFDFLMPGFLGTERQFQDHYEKPIMFSKNGKSSSEKEQKAGELALKNLHRQVLPFILRRVKEDVLQDLPPKIIQDYYCELSPLQTRLYDSFSKSNMMKDLEIETHAMAQMEEKTALATKGRGSVPTSMFQALQYLRQLCSHPKLVLTSQHPESKVIESENINLNLIEHSPKLKALKQLLNDCGIGVIKDDNEENSESSEFSSLTNHRVLLFCQSKIMLNIIEKDFFAEHMPTVTYLRLDGDTDETKRFDLVHKFNSDPTIDILLLTTHAGGLGLNLTGADTVVFMEHDWNPMKDLQAMDRAHRIGQKKVVTVYRFITRNTVEEKVMGLQKFKNNIASTSQNTENTSLKNMDTSQLVDLFSAEEEPKKAKVNDNKKATMKEIVEQLGELWDETQYQEEYNLDAFLSNLQT